MIANKKFIVALALLVAVVAMVAQAEPDAGKICKEEVPAKEGTAACEKCCNQNGFVHGYIGGLMKWQSCQCLSYDPQDPAVRAAGLAPIFGAALTH